MAVRSSQDIISDRTWGKMDHDADMEANVESEEQRLEWERLEQERLERESLE